MKVLLCGANGWIGGMMCSLLKNNIDYLASDAHVNDKVAVESKKVL